MLHYLDIDICYISGIFTVPVSGAWRLTYSMESKLDSGEENLCHLYINGDKLWATQHSTYNSMTGTVESTSGRVWTLEASAGDKIEIGTDKMDRVYYKILFCAEFIPKM